MTFLNSRFCFHPSTLLTLSNGTLSPLSELSLHTLVLTTAGTFEPLIIYFKHSSTGSPPVPTPAIQLTYRSQSGTLRTLTVTPDHLITVHRAHSVAEL